VTNTNKVVDIRDIENARASNCYKVIACDVNDEMISLQASLMVGVANRLASNKAKATNYGGQIGILSDRECNEFIQAYKMLQEFDYKVSLFVGEHIEQETRFEQMRVEQERQKDGKDKQFDFGAGNESARAEKKSDLLPSIDKSRMRHLSKSVHVTSNRQGRNHSKQLDPKVEQQR
jgi:hypothetical protein